MQNSVTDGLNKAGIALTEGLQQQLAIGQVSGQTYSKEDHFFLENTLGMTACAATLELQQKRELIDITSFKMTVAKEFEDAQRILGTKVILDYPGLLQVCNEHNLFFGHASLFCGDMPPEAREEAKKFDFNKARTVVRTGVKVRNKPVVAWQYFGATGYDLIVAAPITMFNLHSPNKVVISNREIVAHEKGQSPRVKVKPCTQDPVLLMPFESADKKIYFLLITNW